MNYLTRILFTLAPELCMIRISKLKELNKMSNQELLEKAEKSYNSGNLVRTKLLLEKVKNPTGLDRLKFARLTFVLN